MKLKYLVIAFLLAAITFVFGSVVTGQENEPEANPASVSDSLAVDSSFTYQGRLDDSGGPVNGNCDFRFSLWDAANGGSQVGGNHEVANVTVTEGNFTAVVNDADQFGGSAFDGSNRWLQIEARCPAGSGSYTTLTPRQEVTAAPYASYADSAPWSGLIGAPWAFFSGSGTSGELYRSGGVALGDFTDPDGHGLNVQNYVSDKAAVRGVNQQGATIFAEGQLGILSVSPGGLPVGVRNVGVLGLKPANGNNGAAVYGWNSDDNISNYGGIFIADGSGTNNYGIYAAASGATANNVAGYFSGRIGVNTTAPAADIHLLQSDATSSGPGGMGFQFGSSTWKILHTGTHFSFAENGIRLAYIQSGTGAYVQTSDETLKQDVAPIGNVLDGVMQLNPVSYSYISDSENTRVNGFIAQEVEAVFPELVRTDENGKKGLAYSDFGALAVAAIQEQQALIANLQQENAALRAEIEGIKSQLGAAAPASLPGTDGSFAITARNDGNAALETGDLVVVSGIAAPPSGTAEPLLLVQNAATNSSGAVVGVVQAAGGPAAPGSLVPVQTRGMAQVKVDASDGDVQAGDLLIISPTTGTVVSMRSNQLDSTAQYTIIGTALEPLAGGSGLLWALVDPR